mgnify:CR=1 FL=1
MDIYKKRRSSLIELIKAEYGTSGLLVLFANFEQDSRSFLQESNFFYLTGINEPGTVIASNFDGKADLYVADTGNLRSKWVAGAVTTDMAPKLGLDAIKYLGQQITGYEQNLFITKQNYANLIDVLKQTVISGDKIFTVSKQKLEQSFVLEQLSKFIPDLQAALVDVSDLIAKLRRVKSDIEIDYLCQAIDVTGMAQEAAAQSISAGALECEVQAAIEFVMTASGNSVAFPSIVGSGKNSTILHYVQNDAVLQKNDLVVIDIGARCKNYCADITRTYPVSGKFTKRQREIYELVLEAQEYIAEKAQPGIWIVNKEHPEKSLLHLAREFLRKKGDYDQYFIHGIGHYLGLDVHDVGSYATPLQDGDVITIEPGIYIPEENLGVRIEDNYLITAKGAICLSDQIAKQADEIERLVSTRSE